jgi:tartronate-semialdehyde synthase
MASKNHVPALVEVITERIANIAMGTEIDKITEFEPIVDLVTQTADSTAATPGLIEVRL